MSREIKFRAWHEKSRKMIDLEKITPLALNIDNPKGVFVPFDMPVMQYTGLKDKNGKEIYEGDVVVYDNAFFVVVFVPGEIGMKRIKEEKSKPTYRLHKVQGEVIGNIYENPELTA